MRIVVQLTHAAMRNELRQYAHRSDTLRRLRCSLRNPYRTTHDGSVCIGVMRLCVPSRLERLRRKRSERLRVGPPGRRQLWKVRFAVQAHERDCNLWQRGVPDRELQLRFRQLR